MKTRYEAEEKVNYIRCQILGQDDIIKNRINKYSDRAGRTKK